MTEPVFSVAEFVAVFNQTLEFAYPSVTIIGELSELRISKSKWLFFNLQDDEAKVNFFGTTYNLPGPLEEGMMLKVRGRPQLNPRWGFSINVTSIAVTGEGSLNKAFKLLEAKLTKEGLFDPSRKRSIPYPPKSIGLITSGESAAFADFCKILNQRWGGLSISLFNVSVQGDSAASEISQAITYFNSGARPADALVITRGGGSAEDLAAFSSEAVVRAVAASRIPTVVAVGHETDISLSEKAADLRASTPSNAAELLVPDKNAVKRELAEKQIRILSAAKYIILTAKELNRQINRQLTRLVKERLNQEARRLADSQKLLDALSPRGILRRGYAILRSMPEKLLVKSVNTLKPGSNVAIEVYDGLAEATIRGVNK